MRKSSVVLAGLLVAFFGLNRASAFVNGGRFDSGSALASGWNGVESDDDAVAAEPDTAPPNISGSWEGSIEDSIEGSGTFALDITQNSRKISGEWDTSFGGPGEFKGSVSGSGHISIKIETPTSKHRGCHANAKGTASDTSIKLSFKFAGCGPKSGEEFGTISLSPI